MALAVLGQKLAVRQKMKEVEAASAQKHAIFRRLKTKSTLSLCIHSTCLFPSKVTAPSISFGWLLVQQA